MFVQDFFFVGVNVVQLLVVSWCVVMLVIYFLDGLLWQRFLFFQQCQMCGVIVVGFKLMQLICGFQQSVQQCFFYVVGIDNLCGDMVDRGVEEIQVDMYMVEQVMMDDFVGNCLGFIVQEYYVVVILVYWVVDVQQQLWYVEYGGGNFVGNYFSGMEVFCIQVQCGLMVGGVVYVEFIGVDGVVFCVDVKQFVFNGVDVVCWVEFFVNDFIQCFQQVLVWG